MKNLFETLQPTQTEEEVKNIFAKFFRLKLDTKNRIDLYTPQILFEFKFDANLNNVPTRAACIAQTLYYIRRLKYGREVRTPSNSICVVTKNFSVLAPTKTFSNFYLKSKAKNFDWDLAPSSPCKNLVAALAADDAVKNLHVYNFSIPEDQNIFIQKINQEFSQQLSLFADKKIIDEYNFFEIFQYWQKLFGDSVENGKKSSEYFITDIEQGRSSILDNGRVLFRMSSGGLVEKKINLEQYRHFWSVYEKISTPREVISIRQKMDRMTEIDLRRRTGEFFTPINFAEKAVEYLSRVVGENWYKSGKFRLWDMAAGTGNLEFALPAEALQYCYISTLLQDDADYCKKIFPDATVFQYDYLNDDVQFFLNPLFEKYFPRKMPPKLVDDLKNPNLQWIIFINPPYATANNYERDKTISKDGVSMTAIRKLMTEKNLGKSSQELFAQFLYRIHLEFDDKKTLLGMFSKIKYLNANADQPLRDKIFQYRYERGFLFHSKSFDGCKGNFPVGFLIWNLAEKISLETQNISADIFNADTEKIAVKKFFISHSNDTLNKWFKRPRNTKKFPPMASAFKVAREHIDRNDKIAENFLAGFMITGTDIFHQNYTALLSGPYASHAGYSITPENFEQSLVVHMVRRLPKATWLNDRDQFMQPLCELPREFICDAVVWSLFAPSNQTVSLRNVEYEGETYHMKNNLFPFLLEELKNWKIADLDLRLQVAAAKEDRFAATWLEKNSEDISAEARAVLEEGRRVYKKFYAELEDLDRKKFRIEDWDAGWYQVRMSLGETISLKELGEKLLPQIYEYGFLRDEVKYF